MKIINDGLTPVLYQAVLDANTDYSPGEADITTTSLIGPAWIRHLYGKHERDLEIPASSQLWMLDGTAMHSLLEKAGRKLGWIIEERFYADCAGVKLGGQIDAYDPVNKILYDYKKSFVSQYMYGIKPEYVAQMNVNKFLLEENGHEVKELKIVYYLKDFRKAKVGFDPDYPDKIEAVSDVPVWDDTWQFILDRLAAHDHPEPCSGAEKWAKYAVIKSGRKTALRVLNTEQEAYAWIAEKVSQAEVPIVSVEERAPGRCKDYCMVNSFCPWWQENKNKY